MKSPRSVTPSLFTALLAALFCVTPCFSAPREAEDLGALRARIESLKSELDQKETTRRESRDALRESERAISDASRELRSLEEQAQAARDELAGLSAKRRDLGQGLEKQQAVLARMLAARYAAGPPDVLRVALS